MVLGNLYLSRSVGLTDKSGWGELLFCSSALPFTVGVVGRRERGVLMSMLRFPGQLGTSKAARGWILCMCVLWGQVAGKPGCS